MGDDEGQVEMRRELPREMNVHVPEAGDEEPPRAVDDDSGWARARGRCDASNPAVLDPDGHAGTEGRRLRIDDRDVLDEQRPGGRRRFGKALRPENARGERAGRENERDGEKNERPLEKAPHH